MWKNGSHANTILDYFFYISNIHFTYEESIIEVSMHISLYGISCVRQQDKNGKEAREVKSGRVHRGR